MTTKILIHTKKQHCCLDFFVHEDHENDLIHFLINHLNKQPLTATFKSDKDVEWFLVKLTSDDVDTIKNTAWYKNAEWDFPQLYDVLQQDTIVELIQILKGE